MRRRLEVELPGVPVLDGTAEDIPLPDASVKGVTAGQAFHWFDTHRALDEIAGVRPAGWLAALNERPESGWAAERDLRTELTGGTRAYPGEGWTEVLAADDRFGPRPRAATMSWSRPPSTRSWTTANRAAVCTWSTTGGGVGPRLVAPLPRDPPRDPAAGG